MQVLRYAENAMSLAQQRDMPSLQLDQAETAERDAATPPTIVQPRGLCG